MNSNKISDSENTEGYITAESNKQHKTSISSHFFGINAIININPNDKQFSVIKKEFIART